MIKVSFLQSYSFTITTNPIPILTVIKVVIQVVATANKEPPNAITVNPVTIPKKNPKGTPTKPLYVSGSSNSFTSSCECSIAVATATTGTGGVAVTGTATGTVTATGTCTATDAVRVGTLVDLAE